MIKNDIITINKSFENTIHNRDYIKSNKRLYFYKNELTELIPFKFKCSELEANNERLVDKLKIANQKINDYK